MLSGESLDLPGLLSNGSRGITWNVRLRVVPFLCGSGPVGFYPLSSPFAAARATASRREDTPSFR